MSADQRRELVLEAARAEFGQGGYEATTTEAIARRVGVSQPYLFRLFPSKKAIFLATIEACFEQLEELFDHVTEGLTGEESLMAMGRAYNALIDNRGILQMQLHMWANACHDADVRDVARRRMARLWQQTERISGADDTRVMQFIASGMLFNVFAAMELPRIKEQLGEALTGLARPNEARPNEARPNKARPNEARPNEARPNEARPDEARPDEAGPSEAGSYEAGSDEAGASEAGSNEGKAHQV
jgi:AcrR family transcriptional regulator